MLILGGLVDALRMAGLRANPRHVQEFRQGRGQIGMGPDDLPDDLLDDEQPRVKIHPPIFKGTPGEWPDAHIYAAEDWMEAMRVRRDDFITKFKHTLNHLAREWYHSLDLDQFEGDWNWFTTHFSRYFSTQGRNIKHLHERWRTFTFDPANDDIEEYIRDVKEAAKQLGHGDDAVVNLLKATMPTELYGTLYGHNNLPQLCTMLKDIYARKPQAATSSATTTPSTSAPFTMIKALPRTPEPTLEDKLTHLTDTLYRMDIDSKPPKKPFKPFITPPHRRFRGSFDKGRSGKGGRFGQFGQSDRRNRFTSNRGRFRPRRPFEKFDKSPNSKRPHISGKTISKDKVRCYKCREFGHYRDECPVDDKQKQDETNNSKRFEDYTYTYSGPDVQPQMQMSSMHPSLSTGYDQALGVIKDSINAANPLASLNL